MEFYGRILTVLINKMCTFDTFFHKTKLFVKFQISKKQKTDFVIQKTSFVFFFCNTMREKFVNCVPYLLAFFVQKLQIFVSSRTEENNENRCCVLLTNNRKIHFLHFHKFEFYFSFCVIS